jgi:hypothetical protein
MTAANILVVSAFALPIAVKALMMIANRLQSRPAKYSTR